MKKITVPVCGMLDMVTRERERESEREREVHVYFILFSTRECYSIVGQALPLFSILSSTAGSIPQPALPQPLFFLLSCFSSMTSSLPPPPAPELLCFSHPFIAGTDNM